MTFNKYTTLAALAATTNAISIASEAQGDFRVGINPVTPPDSEHVTPPFDPSIIGVIGTNPVPPMLDTNTLPA